MLKSSNFWTHLVVFVGATVLVFYPGMDHTVMDELGALVLGLFSVGNILFKFFSGQPERAKWTDILGSKHFWMNLATFLTGLFSFLPLESLEGLIDASLTGNFQLILIQVFNVAGIVFKTIKGN